MTDRELMQQALDAATEELPKVDERETVFCSIQGHHLRALCEFVRAALAQPEQEPIATLFGSLPVYDVPPKQEPVAWVENLENAQPHCVTDLKYCSVAQHERGEHLKYIPLYTAPPQREWQGLTTKDLAEIPPSCFEGAIWADAKLKEKNT